jgi:hypothetical protein
MLLCSCFYVKYKTRFADTPFSFWIESIFFAEGDCCFWHSSGMPENNQDNPVDTVGFVFRKE